MAMMNMGRQNERPTSHAALPTYRSHLPGFAPQAAQRVCTSGSTQTGGYRCPVLSSSMFSHAPSMSPAGVVWTNNDRPAEARAHVRWARKIFSKL